MLMSSIAVQRWVVSAPLWLLALLIFAPIIFLLSSWWNVDTELWRHLWDTQLLGLVVNTLILLFGVGVGVTVIGVGLAWLTALCDFPGRRFFDWALILPLAVPAYVLAFVALGIFDFGGPAQSLLRQFGMTGYFDIRGPVTVVTVMTLVLYPYVYLLARSAFLSQGTELLDVAQTLGVGRRSAFFRVAIPAARPGIVAGVSLALMEALADFGAVAIFGFDTFTTAIYKSWYSLFSLHTAAQLASLLLLFVVLTVFTERGMRSRITKLPSSHRQAPRQRIVLGRFWGGFATISASLVVVCAVFIPLWQLSSWVFGAFSEVALIDFYELALRTIGLGILAALCIVPLAMFSAFTCRRANITFLPEVMGLGYALPGSVLAVGIMLCLAMADQVRVSAGEIFGFSWSPVFLGSLFGMLVAYLIRFFRPGYGAIDSAMSRVKPSYLEAGALMGVNRTRRFLGISLPLILPGVLTASLIVFVDVIKEMPASLLLRPFGWDTLAIKIYELTSEGEWQRAALPSLFLVLVSFAPVILLIRQSRRHSNV